MQSGARLCGWILAAGAASASCDGPLSALAPAGRDAAEINEIFFWMTIGAAILWTFVIGLALAVGLRRVRESAEQRRHVDALYVIGGGVVLPVSVLTLLTAYALPVLPRTLALAADDTLAIEVTGHQWWWRVRYFRLGADPVELANELHLPVGRRLTVQLRSEDVIHSFWVPSIAGKLDMIPGRVNRIALEPQRTGEFRGACAEFCGDAHARMQLVVRVTEAAEFASWLDSQAAPAVPAAHPLAAAGRQVFEQSGCVACHTIRGTMAAGRLGPDLTHVGSRATIGAGLFPTSQASLLAWVANTDHVKPGTLMPPFRHLPGDQMAAVAAYLAELK
jgi:cytochrome c oxidase subunit 2